MEYLAEILRKWKLEERMCLDDGKKVSVIGVEQHGGVELEEDVIREETNGQATCVL